MDRIDNQGTEAIAARPRARAAAPVARSERVRPVAADADQTGAAALAAVGLAGTEAPVDHARVDRIRNAIEQGRYLLDPRKTADAIIAGGFMLRNER
ncbi:flagellar biosynthesis anti-sigma factor FlgM [Pelagerythrobacter sp.]|uniref:flagellar biosynthesis anti-sigma factor FlgM n=1 Tax=Pelagerythrobacter sp. TaxID=2800702 RepID=UPI0035B37B05